MRGDDDVIELLNEVLTGELTAVNQYFIHARMQENWGFRALGDYTYHESIDEMKHADELIRRILFLEGVPNLQRLGTLTVGETVPEQLELDLAVERVALERLRRGIKLTIQKEDHGSRDLLERILHAEEEHVDWLETQLSLIQTLGVEHYLANQTGSADSS